jgi:ribosome-associated translation inhibitor RaiA
MSDDKTMRMVTNLDRPAIEAKLGELHRAAKAKGLADLAQLFFAVEGMPKAQIEARVRNAQKWLAGKAEHGDIAALLDLVEMNLKNLK